MGANSINVIKEIQARKIRGQTCIRNIPTELYSSYKLYRKLMGHLSSVYCVCFDQSGQYIFTGADDYLIKVWSARDGRLLKTLRGHGGQIADMTVNYENRLLASCGMDRVIRIWDLKTSKLLENLLAHSAMVTSLKFAPYNRHGTDRYLISTSNDGSVIFWSYHVDKFEFKKLKKFQERNRPGGRIVCSSFSTGGSFLACGATDNFIHVYGFHPEFGPYNLKELDYHRDQVDSIQFSNLGCRFITGSKDGTATIWTFRNGDWLPLKLDMMPTPSTNGQARPKVLIVQWSRDDRYVMTSSTDCKIRVWESRTGKLVHLLDGHKQDTFLLESHPFDPRIFISASHDGTTIIWDLERGKKLEIFENNAEIGGTQGTASIYDVKFSPDGQMIAATDSHGYLSIFGTGSGEAYKDLPEEMFFHTDYRSLIRDVNQFVMDEQTHIAPHLMPRPTLVDMNGDPYPQSLQRLVPEADKTVVVPMSETKINLLAETIANHSKQEDEEYLAEKRSHSEPTMATNGETGNRNRDGVHRYSTRHSFQSARDNFLMTRSRRTRNSVRYFVDEEEVEEHEEEEEDEEEMDDESTEIDSESTEIDSDATEIYSDATEIDSDATEIAPFPERPQNVRRSARLRNRKRFRTY